LNRYGMLGLGDIKDRGDGPDEMGASLPTVSLGEGRRATSIVVGDLASCAMLENGTVKCWGANYNGQLGLGDRENRGDDPGEMGDDLPPVRFGTGVNAVRMALGNSHACALLSDGSVKCWGSNDAGQLGLGLPPGNFGDGARAMGDDLPRVSLGTGRQAAQIAAGGFMTCVVLDDASTKCWGLNSYGMLGLGDTEDRGDDPGEMGDDLERLRLGTGRHAIQLAICGDPSSCALLDDGRVKCWGAYPALGLGDANSRGDESGEMGDNLPALELGSGSSVASVATGQDHACALFVDGSLKCWGANDFGQLGLGDVRSRGEQPGEMGENLPFVSLGTGRRVKAIAIGQVHACALLDDGTVKCWGSNMYGELGLGDTEDRGDEPGEMGDALPVVALGF
jgi:alpha-tubulin suppressor-like RCC1 family protein